MPIKAEFVELAKQELDDASTFYDFEMEGLKQRFRDEVQSALEMIADQPRAWPEEKNGIRKYVLPRFPYNIFFANETDCLLILAIAHHRRTPNYWVDRL